MIISRFYNRNRVSVKEPIKKVPKRIVEPARATSDKLISQKTENKDQKKISKKKTLLDMSTATDTDFNVEGLNHELLPFQRAGVEFGNMAKGRFLIGDAMGLGKTTQSLSWVYHNKAFPTLVVCPAHLKYNWQDEAEKWFSKRVSTHVVVSSDKHIKDADLTIINYDILNKFTDRIKKKRYKTIIFDESQYIQSYKSLRTKASRKISKGVDHVIGLSGTPFMNRPVELFTILNIICPSTFSSFFKYAYRYCGPKVTKWATTFKGATNIQELANVLRQTVMIRRDKKEVLPQLPDKNSIMIRFKPKHMREYNRILADSDIEPLPKMGKLRQQAVRCKIEECIKWIIDFMDGSDEKLIVFAHHQEFIEYLNEKLKNYMPVVLTGKQSAEVKHQNVKSFQENKKNRIAICSMRAVSTGYNLTASSNVCFIEFDWNYQTMSQCYSRSLRIGQKKSVNIYYFVANGTIEEHMYRLISTKLDVFSNVFDKKEGVKIVDEDYDVDMRNSLLQFIDNKKKRGPKK